MATATLPMGRLTGAGTGCAAGDCTGDDLPFEGRVTAGFLLVADAAASGVAALACEAGDLLAPGLLEGLDAADFVGAAGFAATGVFAGAALRPTGCLVAAFATGLLVVALACGLLAAGRFATALLAGDFFATTLATGFATAFLACFTTGCFTGDFFSAGFFAIGCFATGLLATAFLATGLAGFGAAFAAFFEVFLTATGGVSF